MQPCHHLSFCGLTKLSLLLSVAHLALERPNLVNVSVNHFIPWLMSILGSSRLLADLDLLKREA